MQIQMAKRIQWVRWYCPESLQLPQIFPEIFETFSTSAKWYPIKCNIRTYRPMPSC